jgi:hypothetical protein
MSEHGFTHSRDIPGIDGLSPDQRVAVGKIAAEAVDFSGYVRTECASCGATMCECTDAQWLGRIELHRNPSPERPSFLSSEKTGPEPDASNVSGSGPIVGDV